DADLARTAGQFERIRGPAALRHPPESRGWLNGANEHRADPVFLGGEVEQVVHPVVEIDVDLAPGFRERAAGVTPRAVVRRAVGLVGLGLADEPLASPEAETAAEKRARHRERFSGEESRPQRPSAHRSRTAVSAGMK